MTAAIYVDADCSTCHGSGKVTVDYGDETCPSCRLASRYAVRWCDTCHEERPVAGMRESRGEFGNTYTACARCVEAAKVAHEASVEGQWKALRDGGADELTLRAAGGDR